MTMLSMLAKMAIILLLFIIGVTNAFTQIDSFQINVNRNIEQEKIEKANLSNEENKLRGILLNILLLSEQSDTSQEAQAKLTHIFNNHKLLKNDHFGKIKVILILSSINDTNSVKQIIESVGGTLDEVGRIPYIQCSVPPKKLRNLINSSLIRNIHLPGAGVADGVIREVKK